jgi:uncharacterized protein YbaP (TraB family)
MEASYFNDYVDLIQDRTYHWQIEEIKAWTSSNFSRFGSVLKSIAGHQTPYTTFYYERLIKDRNASLGSKIAGIATKYDNQLFAVGSEHLVGPESVLDALRADGFTVSRVQRKVRGQK